jgi:hypothetical protein
VSFWSWVQDRIEDIGNESGMAAVGISPSAIAALLAGAA